jgi:hypothetical protein
MHYLQNLFSGSVWREIGLSALLLLFAFGVGWLIHAVLFGVLGRVAKRAGMTWGVKTLQYARRPSSLLFPLMVLNLVAPSLRLPAAPLALINQAASILFVLAVAYMLISLVRLLRDFLLSRHDITVSDNLRARTVYTQIQVLEKVLFSVVAVGAASFILMTFDGVRQIGLSLLASAGIAGQNFLLIAFYEIVKIQSEQRLCKASSFLDSNLIITFCQTVFYNLNFISMDDNSR